LGKKLTKKEKRSKYNQSLDDKLIYNGIRFRSKLEVNHYKYFLSHPNIEVLEFEPYFLLLDPFSYYDWCRDKQRKYGKLSYKSDFKLKIKGVDKEVIVECKGMVTQAFQLREKLWYNQYGNDYYYMRSKSLKYCKVVLDKYL
jgi:hypothetical protein